MVTTVRQPQAVYLAITGGLAATIALAYQLGTRHGRQWGYAQGARDGLRVPLRQLRQIQPHPAR